jgi:peptidoglycan/LPS O-acetylase OafA/YrhL
MALHATKDLGFAFTPANIAVRLFFAMSGFYMAMVYEGKYSGRYRPFLASRFLRIWPPYAAALLVALGLVLAVAKFRGRCVGPALPLLCVGVRPSFGTWVALAISNLGIFGQDWGWCFHVDELKGSLSFAPSMVQTESAFQYQLIPQGWSLASELVFYLCLPLILKLSNRALWSALLATFALRITAESLGKSWWILPLFDLPLFFAGILAWRNQSKGPRLVAWAWLFLACVACAAYLPFSQEQGTAVFILSSVFVMPEIFSWTKARHWDRLLGEMSYPFYIFHFSVLWALPLILGRSVEGMDLWLWGFPLAMAVSWAAWFFLVRPLERYRSRFAAVGTRGNG